MQADVVVGRGEADLLGGEVTAVAGEIEVPRLLHLPHHGLQADVEQRTVATRPEQQRVQYKMCYKFCLFIIFL